MERNKLNIINAMLRVIGEFAVDSELDSHPDVSICSEIIDSFKDEILSNGWWFNKKIVSYNLNTDGTISIPSTVIHLDATDTNRNVNIINGKLFDVDNNTYVFTKEVELSIISDLDILELPPVMFNYLKASCVVEFAGISHVTGTALQRAQVREAMALRALEKASLNKLDINFSNHRLKQRLYTLNTGYNKLTKMRY